MFAGDRSVSRGKKTSPCYPPFSLSLSPLSPSLPRCPNLRLFRSFSGILPLSLATPFGLIFRGNQFSRARFGNTLATFFIKRNLARGDRGIRKLRTMRALYVEWNSAIQRPRGSNPNGIWKRKFVLAYLHMMNSRIYVKLNEVFIHSYIYISAFTFKKNTCIWEICRLFVAYTAVWTAFEFVQGAQIF